MQGARVIVQPHKPNRDMMIALATLPEEVMIRRPSNANMWSQPDLMAAASDGLTGWIIPCDADEFWSCIGLLDTVDPSVGKVVVSSHGYLAKPWMRSIGSEWCKIAYRATPWACLAPGNHSVLNVAGDTIAVNGMMIHHFPWRGAEQIRQRHAARLILSTSLPSDQAWHWRIPLEEIMAMAFPENTDGFTLDLTVPKTLNALPQAHGK